MRGPLEWVRGTTARRVLYFGGFVLGGFLANGLPWFHWAHGELERALNSASFRTVVSSWPLGLLMIAILFRAPIAAQIKEIIEISFGNTRARFNRPQEERPPLSSSPLGIPADQGAVRLARVEVPAQVEAPAPAPAAQLLADQVLSSTNDPLYIQRGDKVREALAEAGVLDIPDLAVRVLTRLTGTWIMIAAFENLYGFLWGGQVTLLRDTAGAPMPLARAAAFFEEWRKRNPSAPPDSIDRWIAFLETNGLLEKQGDQLHPTIKGHSFLHFLQEFNRPDPMFYR